MNVLGLLAATSFEFSLYPDERVAGSQFEAEVRAWAALLQDVPDRAIPIFGHMHPSMMAAWVGALRAGKLPAFISFPSHKIRPEDYEAKLRNYQDRLKNRFFIGLPGDPISHEVLLTPERLPREGATPVLVPRGPDDPLFLQCSSGSTGMQKAVAITSRQLQAQLDSYARAIQLDPRGDRIVSWLPLYHDMGLITGLLLPLLTGTPLALIDTFEWAANPALLLHAIQRERATLCWLPNFAFAVLSRLPAGYDLGSMRAFVNCSEPVTREAFHAFARRHGVRPSQLSVSYGLAENVFAVSQTPMGQPPRALSVDRAKYQQGLLQVREQAKPGEPGPEDHELWSCGPLIPGVEVCLEVENGKDIGELLIRGPTAVPGYFELPPEQDADGWLPTGDLGFMYDGELYCCGRKKDLIIHHGRNVFPQDLEQIANADPEVHGGRTVAVGHHDPGTGSEEIFLLFEPHGFLGLEQRSQVSARLKRKLGVLLDVDASVIPVPRAWLKKTSSGKIARRANLEAYRAAQSRLLHVWGDSHAWIFFGLRGFRGTWLGPHTGATIRSHIPRLTEAASQIDPGDIVLLQGGEPECRSLIPVAPDPLQHIAQSVAAYRELFQRLRGAWQGTLAFMTDIPTQALTFDHGDPNWPILGTGEARYRYQELLYRQMAAMCREEGILFLDACTPLLGPDGYMDNTLRVDAIHLDKKHIDVYVRLLEGAFGPVDWEPVPAVPSAWDGTRPHFEQLARALVRQVAPGRGEPDYQRLVSGGTLTSLAIAELTMRLRETFQVEIPLSEVRRERFDSLDAIFEHYVKAVAR